MKGESAATLPPPPPSTWLARRLRAMITGRTGEEQTFRSTQTWNNRTDLRRRPFRLIHTASQGCGPLKVATGRRSTGNGASSPTGALPYFQKGHLKRGVREGVTF